MRPDGSAIVVEFKGAGKDGPLVCELAAEIQSRFAFHESCAWRSACVCVTKERSNRLFSFDTNGIRISSWQLDGLCRYAGLEACEYLLLCAALGLLQYRALGLNPLLRPDDLIERQPSSCLYSNQPLRQSYALLLESPRICDGCTEFFRCLGCEPEMEALLSIMSFLREKQTIRAA